MPKDDLTPKDPHDRLFKRVMSDEANVRQFIKKFLPKEIASKLGGEEIMPSLAEKLIKQGKREGEIKGAIKGKQDLLIKLLRRKFGLSSSDEKMIRSVTDEFKLDAAAEAVLDAKSKEEVLKLLGQ